MPNEPPKRRVVSARIAKQQAAALAKKYRHILSDINPIFLQLQNGETPGDQMQGIGLTIYKVRIRNRDLQKGKSSGYRLIYWLKDSITIVIVSIYSKLDQSDISADEIRRIIKEYEGR